MSKKKSSKKTALQRRRKFSIKKLLVIVIGLVFIASSLIAAGLNSRKGTSETIEVSGQPAIKVDTERIDYGDVKLNQSKSFAIEVSNVGDQPLRFAQAPFVEVAEGC